MESSLFCVGGNILICFAPETINNSLNLWILGAWWISWPEVSRPKDSPHQ
jgi:hypothetical protein